MSTNRRMDKLQHILIIKYSIAMRAIDTHNSMDEFHNIVLGNRSKHKRMHIIWFYLYKIPKGQNLPPVLEIRLLVSLISLAGGHMWRVSEMLALFCVFMSVCLHGCVHSVKIYWTVHFWCVHSSAFRLYFNKFFKRCWPWPTDRFPNPQRDYDFQFPVNGALWSCAGQWPVVILPQAARWVFQVNCSWVSTEHTAPQR